MRNREAKLVKPGKIVVVEEEKTYRTGAGKILIQVKSAGICGTDLHIFKGERSDVSFPRIMGHELSGIVTAIGENVKNFKHGDRVVVDPVISCGKCRVCRSGHENVCSDVKCLGVQCDGGFQDYIEADAERVYHIPDHISFEQAALAEPFSVAANILDRAEVREGEFVVIIGAGTIGIALLQGAKARKATVCIADVEEEKLKKAKTLRADYVINSRKKNLIEEIRKIRQEGADVIVDAVGTAALTAASFKLAAPRARIMIISFDHRPVEFPVSDITKKELTVLGSRMNCHKFPEVLEWMNKSEVKPDAMISAAYSLEEIQKAFEYTIQNGRSNIKTIIRF